MGSFNIQCCVSQQVISNGNPCYVVPILQSRTYNPISMQHKGETLEMYGVAHTLCSPDSLWSPVAPFIEAVYNDYGQVSPIDTPVNRVAIVEFFTDMLNLAPVVLEGENQCHDLAFDLKRFVGDEAPGLAAALAERKSPYQSRIDASPLDFEELKEVWDYVWTAVDENRVFRADYGGNLRPLQFAAIHKTAALRMIRYVEEMRVKPRDSYELVQYLKNLIEYAETRQTEYLDKAPENRLLLKRMRLTDGLRFRLDDSGAHGLMFAFTEETYSLVEAYMQGSLTVEDMAEKLRPLLTGVYVTKAMDWLHLAYSPIFTGSQDYDNESGRQYAALIADISREVTQQQKEHYGE